MRVLFFKGFPIFCKNIIHDRCLKINNFLLIFSKLFLSFSTVVRPQLRTDKKILKKAKFVFTSGNVYVSMYVVKIGNLAILPQEGISVFRFSAT